MFKSTKSIEHLLHIRQLPTLMDSMFQPGEKTNMEIKIQLLAVKFYRQKYTRVTPQGGGRKLTVSPISGVGKTDYSHAKG